MELDFNSLLAVSFGMWAGVVAWIGKGVFRRMDSIASQMQSEAAKLNEYIVQTERRIAVVEDRLKVGGGHER